MEQKASTARSDLEQMLVDETAEPKALKLSLLEDITGCFSEDQVIGSGGFAVVYKGILGDRAVAVKRLSNAYMHEKQFHREVECLMQVKHKNVVRFLGYCADTQGSMERYNGKLVMADVQERLLCFEYIPKGSLDKYIIDAYREWGMCYRIIKGICQGLHYLHENHIIHLDLKLANILLDDNMIPKITDFGLSRCFNENQSRDITKTILGTIGYLAPEHCAGGEIARSADLYSLGVIILEILTGHKGYQAVGDVLQSWSDRLDISQQDTLCEQIQVCYDIALECRDFNPKKRPASARDIIDRLHEMESIQMAEPTLGVAAIESKAAVTAIGTISGISEQEKRKLRDRFNKNGGQLLKSININIYTKEKLQEITNNYSCIVGRGAFGQVYRGTTGEGCHLVAVKRSIAIIEDRQKESFANEIKIQSKIRHPNIVQLLGCCLETEVPMLVYEFMLRGSLQDVLHVRKDPLLLETRLNIAIYSAVAFAYMHLHASHRILLHGDVKTGNILLDEDFTPKVSDFGTSRLMSMDKDHTNWVIGDSSYIDPVYMKTGLLTEKSDVYSFGIVLLELITRKKARYDGNHSLPIDYVKAYVDGTVRQMFDKEIVDGGEVNVKCLEEVGKIAIQCLEDEVDDRPTMSEVAEKLEVCKIQWSQSEANEICT